ncbi:hypothetical protein [Streptomyces griseofuscus]|uniref:hypothetical protein n=1 Tax=Streptomyces griseofuscus TaxID=146922 RepID=UPI0036C687D9
MKHDDDVSTLTHPWMRAIHRPRKWAEKTASRYGRTVKHQMIRGASYSAGSGAVTIVIILLKHWL